MKNTNGPWLSISKSLLCPLVSLVLATFCIQAHAESKPLSWRCNCDGKYVEAKTREECNAMAEGCEVSEFAPEMLKSKASMKTSFVCGCLKKWVADRKWCCLCERRKCKCRHSWWRNEERWGEHKAFKYCGRICRRPKCWSLLSTSADLETWFLTPIKVCMEIPWENNLGSFSTVFTTSFFGDSLALRRPDEAGTEHATSQKGAKGCDRWIASAYVSESYVSDVNLVGLYPR